MNGHNELLENEELRAALIQHHSKLVRMRFDGFPQDIAKPSFYYTFNQIQILALNLDYLNTVDWDNGGHATVADARIAVFGCYPSKDLDAIASGWFTDGSDFNRSKMLGEWTYLSKAGFIHRFSWGYVSAFDRLMLAVSDHRAWIEREGFEPTKGDLKLWSAAQRIQDEIKASTR
jgi:hypothetical protein